MTASAAVTPDTGSGTGSHAGPQAHPSDGSPPPPALNHLVGLLPRRDRLRLLDVARRVPLVMEEVLCEPGEPTRYVWFPIRGFISLVASVDGHPSLEVGMVGNEGMAGEHLALGAASAPFRALVQGPGEAWRIGARDFRRELRESPALKRVLDRYVQVRMMQLAADAGCLRFHLIGPRLARWLLMTRDRAHADRFHVTHQFLGYMLGVRRVGVTESAGALQRAGLISYRRGEVTILDRPGLEAAACACYATDRATYAALLQAPSGAPPEGE